MRIIFLTQYFPPEVGAPQNRLFELALHLQRLGAEVIVMTAMPNYPDMKVKPAYRGKFIVKEDIQGIKVIRSWIFVKKSSAVSVRLLNYFSFVFSSFIIGLFKLPKADYLLCESPPLFLGISANILRKAKKAKLIFNVSDLWPESAVKLGLVKNKFFINLSERLEMRMYKRSSIITGQTQHIVQDITSRIPGKVMHWLPNGVDPDLYHKTYDDRWRSKHGIRDTDFLLMYAGILGHAQGLEIILKAADALRDEKNIKFLIVGNGPEKKRLHDLYSKLRLDNLSFLDTQPKSEMPEIIAASDASIIPLKKLDLFKGAIPSKIFENLIMQKPVLLGVEGEAKKLFIDEGNAGIAFEPENVEQLCDGIVQLYENKSLRDQLGNNAYDYVSKNFNRKTIAENFHKVLLENV